MASWQSYICRGAAGLGRVYFDYAAPRSLSRLRRQASGVRPAQTEQQVEAGGVACRWISAPGLAVDGGPEEVPPLLLFLHGGGWVMGWDETHRRLAVQLAATCPARVLAVDYRLAPEHPYPAALQDCVAVYRWLLRSGQAPGRIVLCGDSAGGNLVLTSLLELRDAGDPLPAAAICISPATDLRGDESSVAAVKDTVLSPAAMRFIVRSYLAGQDASSPFVSPACADLSGLPPLLIQAGGDEYLRFACERLAAQARAAGVDVTLELWPRMWHVWHIYGPFLPEAREAIAHIGHFVSSRLARPALASGRPGC